jgi:hypothetical protein
MEMQFWKISGICNNLSFSYNYSTALPIASYSAWCYNQIYLHMYNTKSAVCKLLELLLNEKKGSQNDHSSIQIQVR